MHVGLRKWLFAAFTVIAVLAITMLSYSTIRAQAEKHQSQNKRRVPLEEAIRSMPGCLGVRSVKTESGQKADFIWFRDKKAVLDWYFSQEHQEVMNKYFDRDGFRQPLTQVPDDSGPLLVIASFTRADKPQKPLPLFSQFAIEIYQPVNGGLYAGGRFAPDRVKLSHLRDYSLPK